MIQTDTLVVGAGPQAFTLVSRWVCDQSGCLDNILVLDPSGVWLSAWDHQFNQQQIDVLRSPGVHHPDPNEMALLHANRYLTQTPKTIETTERPSLQGPLRRPTTAAFRSFCQDLAERTGLARRVRPGLVVEAHRLVDVSVPWRWAAVLSDGATVLARRIVWAGNPRLPQVPDGVQLSGDVVAHSSCVDVTTVAPGERIAVLGGAQSSGQLALLAARSGAEVLLLSRGPQQVADLDVDAGWLMEDHLGPFRAIQDVAERRRVVEQARRGSMTADLVGSINQSLVRWIHDVGELSAWPDRSGAQVAFAGVRVMVDRVWGGLGVQCLTFGRHLSWLNWRKKADQTSTVGQF